MANETSVHTESASGPGLAVRLFLGFALLTLLTLGAAALVTVLRGHAVAEQAVAEQLAHSLSVQAALERSRFRRLELISRLFAADPYFASYVAEAQQDDLGFTNGGADSTSITDLLAERQAELGFDFSLVLDAEGMVIARTDGKPLRAEPLHEDALVGPVIESLEPRTGYWSRDGGVFQVSVVPLADGFELAGFLVSALRLDNALANELRQASGAHFVIARKLDDTWTMAAGTPPPALATALLNGLRPEELPASGQSLVLAGERWRVAATPLDDARSAFALTLTDEDAALAGYRAIQAVLAFAALAALAAAMLLGWTISRSLVKPIHELAVAADAAAQGSYHQALPRAAGRELAQLTIAFNRLLSDLREKRDMERFIADLARLQPEPGEQPRAMKTGAQSEQGWLVGLQWNAEGGGPPEQQVLRLERVATLLVRGAAAYRGRLLELGGGMAVLAIPGTEIAPALAVAGKAARELASLQLNVGAAVIASGIVSGELVAGGMRRTSWQGSADATLRQLLAETSPGSILLVKSAGEALALRDIDVSIVAGRVSGRNFYSMRASAAADIGLDADDQTMPLTQFAGTVPNLQTAFLPVAGMVFGGRFEILAELGRGGMGAVFKVLDRELREPVALKVLLAGSTMDNIERESMKTEIRLARRITHPNILRTHDFGEFDGLPFITMEYVRGLTLKFLIQQSGRLPDSAALRIARQVCAGLDAAHRQGVLHRDIKPENIILEPNGNAKLMDFGIAQVVSREGGEQVSVAGTPRYAAPEQMLGNTLDARADIYSLGVVMYQMFTGQLPHRAPDIEALIAAKRAGVNRIPATDAPRPAGLDALLVECLAGEPSGRPSSAAHLLQRLLAMHA